MAKNLKLNIKNTQIAEAINLGSLKNKLAKKKEEAAEAKQSVSDKPQGTPKASKESEEQGKEEAPRIKARSKSAFAEPQAGQPVAAKTQASDLVETAFSEEENELESKFKTVKKKSSEELRKEIFKEELEEQALESTQEPKQLFEEEKELVQIEAVEPPPQPTPKEQKEPKETVPPPPKEAVAVPPPHLPIPERKVPPPTPSTRLGPTGRHMRDLLPHKYTPKGGAVPPKATTAPAVEAKPAAPAPKAAEDDESKKNKFKPKVKGREEIGTPEEEEAKKGLKASKFKEFRDVKPARKQESQRFDVRDRQGLRLPDEEQAWRKRKPSKAYRAVQEDVTIRPTTLKVRVPIAIKDLAAEMKLKSSQLVQKLFLQGIIVTLNDLLEDETTIQLLGQEFGCEITIDTSEEERIRITDKTIKEEVAGADPENLKTRAPVVAFMGHVDHGKTSLIDTIRKSNRAAGEAGAITQHIGAFRCSTAVGDIAILDTPGHEAFSAMRARGADVTDIVVLVVAGDEGIRQQTIEAIQHAKAAKVTIVVALNKSDKPNFNPENVYRQLAEQDLLPEAWGGQTITVNCSAVTGEGIQQLLEMLALQAEVLELKADPSARARGTVLESEMHKGMGAVATVLVQNGTLRLGDCLVFGGNWGRVKTMRDEFGQQLSEADPSTPIEITGLSGLPEAGQEFIVVKNEKEAREIAEARLQGARQTSLQLSKRLSMENLFQQASETQKKILNIVLRADVQGSLEALKAALQKIESKKAELSIIFAGVGEVSESDVQLAAASKAVILGFHTQVESHAESLIKQMGVQVRMHDIIYHAIDEVKLLMAGLLDRIAQETEKGKAEVKATFKSSHHGLIAGCLVTEGSIHRNHNIRVRRGKDVVWKGTISSLKRVKEDVREVVKGLECGILLNNYNELQAGDIIESYEVTYITQEL